MFTKDTHLSENGDCIVAVAADKAVADLSPQFKTALKRSNAKLTVTIEAKGVVEQIAALGSPILILSHPTDVVLRKSSFISDRTLAVGADKASVDLSRQLVEKLKDPKQQVKITLTVLG
jgi:hypothetical protein